MGCKNHRGALVDVRMPGRAVAVGHRSLEEMLCKFGTSFAEGSTRVVCRSGLLSSDRVGSGTLMHRHQQSLSLRVHLPLVIVATKAVARTKPRRAGQLVYLDDEPSYISQ